MPLHSGVLTLPYAINRGCKVFDLASARDGGSIPPTSTI